MSDIEYEEMPKFVWGFDSYEAPKPEPIQRRQSHQRTQHQREVAMMAILGPIGFIVWLLIGILVISL